MTILRACFSWIKTKQTFYFICSYNFVFSHVLYSHSVKNAPFYLCRLYLWKVNDVWLWGAGGGAFTVTLEDFKLYFYFHESINKTKPLHFQTENSENMIINNIFRAVENSVLIRLTIDSKLYECKSCSSKLNSIYFSLKVLSNCVDSNILKITSFYN